MSDADSIPSIAERRAIPTSFQPATRGNFPFGLAQSRLPDMTGAESRQYDPQIAYLMAMISAWAYSDGQTLADKLQYYGFASNTVRHFSAVNQALFVVANGFFVRSADNRVGVLAFRGPEPASVVRWLTHADSSMQPFHGGMIHSGIHANVEAIWGYVDQILTNAALGSDGRSERPRSLYLTGHGLGAAMAVVVAARLFTNDYDDLQSLVKGVYTYGQPMVGDHTFARQCGERFGGRLYRHAYRRDLVPHLPLGMNGTSFAHFGLEWVSNSSRTPWTIHSDAATVGGPKSNRLLAIGRSVLQNLPVVNALNLGSVEDHWPARYVETCRASLAT